MPSAIKPLANITLSSSATSVTFSSISGLYRDLYLVCQIETTANANSYITLNTDGTGTTKYNRVSMRGNGSVTGSSTGIGDPYLTNNDIVVTTGATTTFIYHFMDYATTDKHKPILLRVDRAGVATHASAHRWADTTAINKIVIEGGTMVAGSSFALYGVSA